MIIRDLTVDWAWVRNSVLEKERILPSSGSEIVSAAGASIKKARKIALPIAMTLLKKIVSIGNGSIKVEGGATLSGSSLAAFLNGAEYISLFLVTIGPAIEKEASVLMAGGDTLSGYMLDRTGSFAVESLAENLEDRLRKEYGAKNKSVSMRFSPGYCDWPIQEQSILDKLIDFSKINVRLTESLMMVPKKSISGLVGIGPKGLFSKAGSQCAICNSKDCGYRRI
ncbi:MAG: hypothetical protein JXB40_05185 [Candidatus Omnitrophica bacterium]|nr:hypothetical protein [Candidatus Omnitrophota bacterium]